MIFRNFPPPQCHWTGANNYVPDHDTRYESRRKYHFLKKRYKYYSPK